MRELIAARFEAQAREGGLDPAEARFVIKEPGSQVAPLLVDLFPHVMISSTSPDDSLKLHATASGTYTLTAMLIVTAALMPLVLAYQGWSHRVFAHRLRPSDYAPHP